MEGTAKSPTIRRCDVSGVWRNALGSTMCLFQTPGGATITGVYNTTVESKPGAASSPSLIQGLVKAVEGGGLVSWNVLWKGGKSMTSWVGQCMECEGGKAVIFATWVLRGLKKPEERWMTTRVNQDTFWRVEEGAEQTTLPTVDPVGENPAVSGNWISTSGDVINISQAPQKGKIEGEHLPRGGGSAEALIGSTDGKENFTAIGFSAVGPTSIRGWTGHIYNPGEGPSPVLETSWIAHAFSDDCSDPRRFVSFGMDNYTQPPAPSSDA